MSNGALTQLIAIGAQDNNFLSKDIKDSVFQESTKKISNFSKSTSSMIPSGNCNWGNTIKFKIEKKGDLLSSVYLVVNLPEINGNNVDNKVKLINGNTTQYYFRWANYIGNVIVENIKLFIGGQLIDEHTGEFQQIYTDLYDDDWNKLCLLGMDDDLITPKKIKTSGIIVDSNTLYIPLKFWFCNSLSKALPIIALQYHDIEVEIKLRKWNDCYMILKSETNPMNGYSDNIFVNVRDNESLNNINEIPLGNIRLDCNMIYLDTEERKHIAQSEHKILINQTQKISCSATQTKSIDLNFNHPVKEIFFFYTSKYFEENSGELFNFSDKPQYMSNFEYTHILNDASNEGYSPKRHFLKEARILINGYPRVDWNNYKYYYYLQNYENYRNKLEHYAYIYSFSGNPKSLTPMGSLNFSRIDNAQLQYKINEFTRTERKKLLPNNKKHIVDDESLMVNVYAINYNYLIIKGGMGAVEFSN